MKKATVVDLRRKMNDVLKALDCEKVKGGLIPSGQNTQMKITDHPFFGMSSRVGKKCVLDEIDDLRGGRYNDV